MTHVPHAICRWFMKQPKPITPEEFDLAIDELRQSNVRQHELLQQVNQPDILRSLVISMNEGRNK